MSSFKILNRILSDERSSSQDCSLSIGDSLMMECIERNTTKYVFHLKFFIISSISDFRTRIWLFICSTGRFLLTAFKQKGALLLSLINIKKLEGKFARRKSKEQLDLPQTVYGQERTSV
jgi:hypothetical protein